MTTLKMVFNPLTGQFDQVQDLLNVDVLGFDTTYVTTGAEPVGSLFFESDNHTLTVVLENGVRLQIGREGIFWGVNKTGATIPNGTPVYVAGAQGQRAKLAPCKGDSDATARCVGVTTQDILDNAEGWGTYDGEVHDMTTLSGFADGDEVWISKTTTGEIVNAEPAKPHHSDKIGIVMSNHAVHGVLLVKIFRHTSMRELSDVSSTAPTTTGQLVTWNNTLGLYETTAYNVLDLGYIRTTPSTAAQNTIQPSADVVGLTVKQPVGGTANILNVALSDNSPILSATVSRRIGINNNSPVSNLTVTQTNADKTGIWITGQGRSGPDDPSKGIAILLNYNVSGNRQVFLCGTDSIGLSTHSVFRWVLQGTTIANMDACSGTGTTRMPMSLGTDTSDVAIGNTILAYNATLPGKLAVYSEAAKVGVAVKLAVSQTSDAIQIQNSSGVVLALIDKLGGAVFNETGDANADFRVESDANTHHLFLDASANALGVNNSAPSAYLHIGAGGTAAGTGPLKLTTQAAGLSSVEQGVFELIGNSLQFTQLAKRRGVAMSQNVRTSTTTIENTTTESAALLTAEHGANYLEVGKMEELMLSGTIEQRSNPNAVLTLRVKYAGVTVHTIATSANNLIAAGSSFLLRVFCTVRSIGATGTMQINSWLEVPGETSKGASSLATINTTTAQDTTITAQWGEADTADIFKVEQSRVLCVEQNK